MPKLTEVLKDIQPQLPGFLQEVKIGNQAEIIKLFTEDYKDVSLHYERDEMMKGYCHCLKSACPYCEVDSKPTEFCLLPVFSVGLNDVGVLKLSVKKGPQQLVTQILHHLADPDVAKKMLTIQRVDSYRYRVTAKKDDQYETIGAHAIHAFLERQADIDLGQIFPTHSAEDILSIPDVRRKWNLKRDLPMNEGL